MGPVSRDVAAPQAGRAGSWRPGIVGWAQGVAETPPVTVDVLLYPPNSVATLKGSYGKG